MRRLDNLSQRLFWFICILCFMITFFRSLLFHQFCLFLHYYITRQCSWESEVTLWIRATRHHRSHRSQLSQLRLTSDNLNTWFLQLVWWSSEVFSIGPKHRNEGKCLKVTSECCNKVWSDRCQSMEESRNFQSFFPDKSVSAELEKCSGVWPEDKMSLY